MYLSKLQNVFVSKVEVGVQEEMGKGDFHNSHSVRVSQGTTKPHPPINRKNTLTYPPHPPNQKHPQTQPLYP